MKSTVVDEVLSTNAIRILLQRIKTTLLLHLHTYEYCVAAKEWVLVSDPCKQSEKVKLEHEDCGLLKELQSLEGHFGRTNVWI